MLWEQDGPLTGPHPHPRPVAKCGVTGATTCAARRVSQQEQEAYCDAAERRARSQRELKRTSAGQADAVQADLDGARHHRHRGLKLALWSWRSDCSDWSAAG